MKRKVKNVAEVGAGNGPWIKSQKAGVKEELLLVKALSRLLAKSLFGKFAKGLYLGL